MGIQEKQNFDVVDICCYCALHNSKLWDFSPSRLVNIFRAWLLLFLHSLDFSHNIPV